MQDKGLDWWYTACGSVKTQDRTVTGTGKAKAEGVVAVLWRIVVTVRRTQVLCVIVPTATAVHAVSVHLRPLPLWLAG